MAPDPKVTSRFRGAISNPELAETIATQDFSKPTQKIITLIHGKYYDLTNFKHPGGPIALSLLEGRDGTELFESHHLFTKKDVLEILSSYEVGKTAQSIKPSGVYDWELTKNDPFTKELLETARKVLGKDIKISTARAIEIGILFLLALSQYLCFLRGDWYSLITFPLAYWMFGVIIFHDGCHFSISSNWVINSLGLEAGFIFTPPFIWYH